MAGRPEKTALPNKVNIKSSGADEDAERDADGEDDADTERDDEDDKYDDDDDEDDDNDDGDDDTEDDGEDDRQRTRIACFRSRRSLCLAIRGNAAGVVSGVAKCRRSATMASMAACTRAYSDASARTCAATRACSSACAGFTIGVVEDDAARISSVCVATQSGFAVVDVSATTSSMSRSK
jgi:hypothetical protein